MRYVGVLLVVVMMFGTTPALAEHGGCHNNCQGAPSGAAPYWEELCVSQWQWDDYYQGWWAYDYNPAHYECYPGGHWYWYGNP